MNTRQKELKAQAPKVPQVYINDNERYEPNPSDPTYAEALQAHQAAIVVALYDVCILTGTTVDHNPPGLMVPDSEEFSELLDALDIEVGATRSRRYLQWVKYIAAPRGVDMAALMGPLLRNIGTTEEEVAEAAANFRGDAPGNASNGS